MPTILGVEAEGNPVGGSQVLEALSGGLEDAGEVELGGDGRENTVHTLEPLAALLPLPHESGVLQGHGESAGHGGNQVHVSLAEGVGDFVFEGDDADDLAGICVRR